MVQRTPLGDARRSVGFSYKFLMSEDSYPIFLKTLSISMRAICKRQNDSVDECGILQASFARDYFQPPRPLRTP